MVDPATIRPAAPVEVVVARHTESLRWTRNVPPQVRVTIYNKGPAPPPNSWRGSLEPLPNVGHEAHSYLHHIVTRYDDLAPVTFFVQGHPFDHAHDLHEVLRQTATGGRTVADFTWLGFIIDTDDRRGRRLFVPWGKNHDRRELALDRFHEELFGAPSPAEVHFYPGGQLAVRDHTIRSRPRAFYERALALSTRFPDAAHCFERLWDRVFGVQGVDPALLGGKKCVYLKPIKRLAAPV